MNGEFSIYVADYDLDLVAKIRTSLEKVGYDVEGFVEPSRALKRIREAPPHILITGWTAGAREGDCPEDLFIDRVLAVSSEIRMVLLVEMARARQIIDQIEDPIEETVIKPLICTRDLELKIARVIESIYLKLENEQLYEELAGRKTTGLSSAEPITRSVNLFFDENQQLELFCFLTDLSSIKSHDALLDYTLSFLAERLNVRPVIYLKYLPAYCSLVFYRSKGIDGSQSRGIGMKLDGYPIDLRESYLRQPSKLEMLLKFGQDIFGSSKFELLTVFEGSEVKGILLCPELKPEVKSQINLFIRAFDLSSQLVTLRKRMHDLNGIDLGTRILNRKSLLDGLEAEISRARRLSLPVSLLNIEIESFFEYKDLNGLRISDDLVRSIAGMLKQASRGSDLFGRLSDSQLGVVLPHCGVLQASIKAEKWRRLVEATPWRYANTVTKGKLTIGIGVSEFPGLSSDSIQLLRSSEEALDQVRILGGNRVCQATAAENFTPEFAPTRKGERNLTLEN